MHIAAQGGKLNILAIAGKAAFVVPFLPFSDATPGPLALADRFSKRKVLVGVKVFENVAASGYGGMLVLCRASC